MGMIIILSLVGLVLVLAEVLLVPGVGIAGILGVASIAGSCFQAFSCYGGVTGSIVTAVDVLLIVVLMIFALRAKTWNKFALKTNIDSKAVSDDKVKVSVGETGKTSTRLAPMGMVRFEGMSLEATSFEGMIDAGVEVEVVLIEDGKIYVRPVENDY